MSMAEAGRPIVDWSPRDDAHSGLRHTDRPAARPTGRVQHGYNRVQEIVSDTDLSLMWQSLTIYTPCYQQIGDMTDQLQLSAEHIQGLPFLN